MATRRAQERDHRTDLEAIRAGARSAAWDERLEAVELIRTVLGDVPLEKTVEQILEILDRLAGDAKWEVRRATVGALVDTRRPAARRVIERLVGDANTWVREAADRAKRKLARITSPGDKRHWREELAFDLVKDLRSDDYFGKAYEAALRVGEKHYEELAADTAHELNTHRATVDGLMGELEQLVLRGEGAGTEAKSIFGKLRARSAYFGALVHGLIEYSREPDLEFRLEQLKPMVVDALDSAREKAMQRLPRLAVREAIVVPDDMKVEVCRSRIVCALTNVLSNGFEALEEKRDGAAAIDVSARVSGSDHVIIVVRDSGSGMDPSQVENAKKRFTSGKRERGGIGLGLPMAVKIVTREHHGRLEIESALGIGTTVTIELPMRQRKEV